jgi:SAM-dependent methyltransferase
MAAVMPAARNPGGRVRTLVGPCMNGPMRLRDLQRNWQRMAETDPLWAISTAPEYKAHKWDLEQFFASGVKEIRDAMTDVRAARPDLARGTALDFGCGVGRLSQALADHFDHVTGVDIAPAMIGQGRELNRHGEGVCYVLNESSDLSQFSASSFDFIYSAITLMHMEPRYSTRYIAEFVRLLRPDGAALFQLPAPTHRQQIRDRIPRRSVRGQ